MKGWEHVTVREVKDDHRLLNGGKGTPEKKGKKPKQTNPPV